MKCGSDLGSKFMDEPLHDQVDHLREKKNLRFFKSCIVILQLVARMVPWSPIYHSYRCLVALGLPYIQKVLDEQKVVLQTLI